MAATACCSRSLLKHLFFLNSVFKIKHFQKREIQNKICTKVTVNLFRCCFTGALSTLNKKPMVNEIYIKMLREIFVHRKIKI